MDRAGIIPGNTRGNYRRAGCRHKCPFWEIDVKRERWQRDESNFREREIMCEAGIKIENCGCSIECVKVELPHEGKTTLTDGGEVSYKKVLARYYEDNIIYHFYLSSDGSNWITYDIAFW